MADADTKPNLLKQPGELRNRIYGLVFEGHRVDFTMNRHAPGLLMTCKQTYQEAKSAYYHETIFSTTGSSQNMVVQLKKLPRDIINSTETVAVDLEEEAKTSPCIKFGTKSKWSDAIEANHLMCCARDSELKLSTLREQLMFHGLEELAHKAKGGVVIGLKGQFEWSSTPWMTFCTKFTDTKLPDDHERWNQFFDFKHVKPLHCWWVWGGYNGGGASPSACGCPAIVGGNVGG